MPEPSHLVSDFARLLSPNLEALTPTRWRVVIGQYPRLRMDRVASRIEAPGDLNTRASRAVAVLLSASRLVRRLETAPADLASVNANPFARFDESVRVASRSQTDIGKVLHPSGFGRAVEQLDADHVRMV